MTPLTGAFSTSLPARPPLKARARSARLVTSLSAASISLRGTVSDSSRNRANRFCASVWAARSSATWAIWPERSSTPLAGSM